MATAEEKRRRAEQIAKYLSDRHAMRARGGTQGAAVVVHEIEGLSGAFDRDVATLRKLFHGVVVGKSVGRRFATFTADEQNWRRFQLLVGRGLEPGRWYELDGRPYRVVKAIASGYELEGPQGGEATLIVSEKGRALSLVLPHGRGRSESIDVVRERPGKAPAKAKAKKPKLPTFKEARQAIFAELERRGWTIARGLKFPKASHPKGLGNLWFKSQAVYLGATNRFSDARSTWDDIRKVDPAEFVDKAERILSRETGRAERRAEGARKAELEQFADKPTATGTRKLSTAALKAWLKRHGKHRGISCSSRKDGSGIITCSSSPRSDLSALVPLIENRFAARAEAKTHGFIQIVPVREREKEPTFAPSDIRIFESGGKLHVRYPDKPSREIINQLKAAGFRWSGRDKSWQQKASLEARAKAERITGASFAYAREGQSSVMRSPPGARSNEMEMRAMLEKAGYPRSASETLIAEGMGVEELRERLKATPGSVGALDVTHGIVHAPTRTEGSYQLVMEARRPGTSLERLRKIAERLTIPSHPIPPEPRAAALVRSIIKTREAAKPGEIIHATVGETEPPRIAASRAAIQAKKLEIGDAVTFTDLGETFEGVITDFAMGKVRIRAKGAESDALVSGEKVSKKTKPPKPSQRELDQRLAEIEREFKKTLAQYGAGILERKPRSYLQKLGEKTRRLAREILDRRDALGRAPQLPVATADHYASAIDELRQKVSSGEIGASRGAELAERIREESTLFVGIKPWAAPMAARATDVSAELAKLAAAGREAAAVDAPRVEEIGRATVPGEEITRGIVAHPDGTFEAFTATQRKVFKTRGGAERWYERKTGKKIPKTRVELYQLVGPTGRPIRKATKVIFPDGYEVKFLERLGKKKAIEQATELRAKGLRESVALADTLAREKRPAPTRVATASARKAVERERDRLRKLESTHPLLVRTRALLDQPDAPRERLDDLRQALKTAADAIRERKRAKPAPKPAPKPKRGRGRPAIPFRSELAKKAWSKLPKKAKELVDGEPYVHLEALTTEQKRLPDLSRRGARVALAALDEAALGALVESRRKIPKGSRLAGSPVVYTYERGRWEARATYDEPHLFAPALFAVGETPSRALSRLKEQAKTTKRAAQALERFESRLEKALEDCEKAGCPEAEIRRLLAQAGP